MSLENVTFTYTKEKPVLDDISAEFEPGKLHVIFGPSGCGKTTLLSLLGGLDIPSGGHVYFGRQEVVGSNLEEHRKNHVSFVFQNYNLIDYMNPLENVQLTSKEEPLPVLIKLGLTEEESKRNVLKLSGGQQQRVAIARALASRNPVLLADEPTGNLDEETAREITVILKEAAAQYDRSVIVVSHSNELAKQADVLYELKHGKLIRADRPC